MEEILIRFVVGGTVVSAFAILGELFKPKSFAGLFGAAPSIALATLALTIAKDGKQFATSEVMSMMVGAIAFLCYANSVRWLMMHRNHSALVISVGCLVVWFLAAFGLHLIL